MSNKLDIKDVMGLANQLKLEKNCQIILILDEFKTDDQNKYHEYKEKLIDEEIKINSVEPLIKENTKDLENELQSLLIDFAHKLEIHNYRFFQKVLRLYRKFISELKPPIAKSTKEIILIRILQGYFILDFGSEREFGWSDVQLVLDERKDDWSKVKKNTYEKFKAISYYFISSDQWFIQFQSWFKQEGDFDYSEISDLANSQLISEKNNILKAELKVHWRKFWNNNSDIYFPQHLYDLSLRLLGVEDLENLEFRICILEKLGYDIIANNLEEAIESWIIEKLKAERKNFLNEFCNFRRRPTRFYSFIDQYLEDNPYEGLPSLLEWVHLYIVEDRQNSLDGAILLEKSTKEDWRKLLFDDIPNDERFLYTNSSLVASKMMKQSIKPELNIRIRQIITEIYQEKGKESEFYKKYMHYLISMFDN